jgi:hypothetical protein
VKLTLSAALALCLAAACIAVGSATQTCEFHVGPVFIELDGSAQSRSVAIDTQPGCAWTVAASENWIHPGTAGGSGSGVIPYQVDAIASYLPLRQGFILVRWNTVTAGQNLVVTQTAGPCTAVFFPAPGPTSSLTHGWKGASASFWVLAEPPFSGEWRVASAPDWIAFRFPTPGLTGHGDGSVLFSTAPNPSTSPRDGAVTFCNGRSLVVHQAGRTLRGGDAVPADVDSDGIADPVVYRPSTGTWYALRSSSGYSYGDYLQVLWGASTTIPMPGDYDGDNTMDVAVYDPNGLFGSAPAGNWNVLYSSGGYAQATRTSYPFPTDAFNYRPQNLPLMADFNGDNRPDFVTFRPDSGEWSVALTDFRFPSKLPENFPSGEYNGRWQWGLGGDIAVPADYDGDRLADLAVWRPSNGTWYVRFSTESYSFGTARAYQWGLAGDQPIVGDFDGDGRSDLTVWRPSEGNWYIVYSSQGYSPAAMGRIQWGLPGDIPVANDYDGDGRLDPAVWRPSNGTWYLLMSSQGYSYATYRSIQWGLPGDIPLSARITRSQ